ncbi:hypothetical protein ACJIZ3_007354 [Penstemon smallii]|uniref:Uncharacterized protein n=1 Tax=Penstemon smallii TaxID=265156 RepID=A0ABD3SAA8_9LAMI
MEPRTEEIKDEGDVLLLPLLEPPPKTPAQKAVRKAFKGTAHLSNLLPTGSVLAFQVLSPVITHEGKCKSFVSQTTTLGLLSLCAASCFVLCFTDSFRDERGKVRYGIATFRGIWVIDGSGKTLPPHEADKFRVRFMDFVHAFLSIMVFGAVAMFDKNVINCFYPSPSEEALEMLTALPVTVGVICSLLFVLFPTKRHGIGFPLSRR